MTSIPFQIFKLTKICKLCVAYLCKYTVLQKYRHTRRLLETRVIIKNLAHPCCFFESAILNFFFCKNKNFFRKDGPKFWWLLWFPTNSWYAYTFATQCMCPTVLASSPACLKNFKSVTKALYYQVSFYIPFWSSQIGVLKAELGIWNSECQSLVNPQNSRVQHNIM